MPAIVNTTRITGANSGTIPSTTAGNTLVVLFAGSNGAGSTGTCSTSGCTLGSVPLANVAEIDAAPSQSASCCAAYLLGNIPAGQTTVTVTGTGLVAADSYMVVYELSGMGPAPYLEQVAQVSNAGGVTTWSTDTGTAPTTRVAAEFWGGITQHGPNSTQPDTLTPAGAWTNQTQFNWGAPGGSSMAGAQITSATGSLRYNGTSADFDFYTALAVAIAPGSGPSVQQPRLAPGWHPGAGLPGVPGGTPFYAPTAASAPPLLTLRNSFEGGTSGTAVTTGNSGGTSGNAFDGVTNATYQSGSALHGTVGLSTPLAAQSTDQVTWAQSWTAPWSVFWYRDYYRIASAPPAVIRLSQVNGAGTARWGVAVDSATGKIGIRNLGAGSFAALSTTVVPTAAPHRYEVGAGWDGTNWAVTLRLFFGANVEGVTPDETLNATMALGGADTWQAGALASVSSTWSGVDHDDVTLTNTGWPGPLGVTSVAATAAGTLDISGTAAARAAATASGTLDISGTGPPGAAVTAAGSVTVGGAATAQAAATAAGSVTLGGSATASAPATAAGSVSFGGSVTAAAPATAAGAVTLAASSAATAPATAAGALAINGTATASQPGTTAAGSLTVSGTATATVAAAAAGSATLAGTVTATAPASAAGSLTVAGTATARAAATAAGSVTVNGTAAARAAATATGTVTVNGAGPPGAAVTAAGSVTVAATATARTAATTAGTVAVAATAQASAAGAPAGTLTITATGAVQLSSAQLPGTAALAPHGRWSADAPHGHETAAAAPAARWAAAQPAGRYDASSPHTTWEARSPHG